MKEKPKEKKNEMNKSYIEDIEFTPDKLDLLLEKKKKTKKTKKKTETITSKKPKLNAVKIPEFSKEIVLFSFNF